MLTVRAMLFIFRTLDSTVMWGPRFIYNVYYSAVWGQ